MKNPATAPRTIVIGLIIVIDKTIRCILVYTFINKEIIKKG
jgi:hypothetical protein